MTLFGALWFASLGAGSVVAVVPARRRPQGVAGAIDPAAGRRVVRLLGGRSAARLAAPRVIRRRSSVWRSTSARLRTRQGLLARAALGRPTADDAGRSRASSAGDMAAELRPTAASAARRCRRSGAAHELLDLGARRTTRRSRGFSAGCSSDRTRRAPTARDVTGPGMPSGSASTTSAASSRRRRGESGWRRSPFPTARPFAPSRRRGSPSAAWHSGPRSGPASGTGPRWRATSRACDPLARAVDRLDRLLRAGCHRGGTACPGAGRPGLSAGGGARGRPGVRRAAPATASGRTRTCSDARSAGRRRDCPRPGPWSRRAVPALVERQRAGRHFGATAQQERALIALRVLLWADPAL